MTLYGRSHGAVTSRTDSKHLPSVERPESQLAGVRVMPFSVSEVLDNLRMERYVVAVNRKTARVAHNESLTRRLYYAIRPLLPVEVRKYLQRIALQDWPKIPFPSWPVDTTVERLVNEVWRVVLEASNEPEVPFIWYWPNGFQSCAIMTHDVETGAGQDFCGTILRIEQEYGIRSAFELVPEVRYRVSESVLQAIRDAGSEVCVHGLNHDGRLFNSEGEFRRRARLINQYAAQWGAKGFRSPVMYRNQSWYDAFEFSFDMSVPNVAHLDPQRGGCCTVFPYFIGDILELPLTTVQDYSLYHILRTDPITMWTQQIDTVCANNGLVSFIIHPDYTIEPQVQVLYHKLLSLLKTRSQDGHMWLALPGEVDTWWRQRNEMTLVCDDGSWSIRGRGAERAMVASARLENGTVRYRIGKRDATAAAVSINTDKKAQ
jgi:hypothetical protein